MVVGDSMQYLMANITCNNTKIYQVRIKILSLGFGITLIDTSLIM